MNVLWITNRPIAGAERKLNIKAKSGTWMEPALMGLKKYAEFSFSVASPAAVDALFSFQDDGIKYYLVPDLCTKTHRWKSKDCQNLWREVITSSKPDLIVIWGTEYAHGLCAQTVAEDIPCVIEIQGIIESVWHYYLGGMSLREILRAYSFWNIVKRTGLLKRRREIKKQIPIERMMLERSGNVIVENEWATGYIQSMVPHCCFFYHNLNVNDLFFRVKREKSTVEKNSILCSAPGYPLKGFHYLLRAMRIVKQKHHDVKLYVPGISNPFGKGIKGRMKQDGYEKLVMRMIEQYGLKESVIFLGRLSSQEMAEIMAKCELMVIPSAIENHSITLREAMTVGLPCISSYVGGVPEVVVHKVNGMLYRYEDYQRCAFFIDFCLSNKEAAKRIGNQARKDMFDYLDKEKSLIQLKNAYIEIVEKAKQ